jgi:hypothetical protein
MALAVKRFGCYHRRSLWCNIKGLHRVGRLGIKKQPIEGKEAREAKMESSRQ